MMQWANIAVLISVLILVGVICLIAGFWHDFKDLTVIQKTGIILCVIGYVVPVVLNQVMRILHLG
ncbi:hypothetical protein ABB39_11960 [Levilactobacillus brevis]|uniref:hypothetical protein n=1 Tax=Levilactobacillus brevis TaxID=1580 RepID=UPI00076095DC|nr:hypothetical protein [Levilactobacillus brevis]KWT44418.1 hypothetical protein ABB39_11960 [Levilactobacillus brevis]MBT1153754.1 hypothetical protein [Lactiplantibacillus argentoratensis]